MSFIRTVPPDQATGDVRAIYEQAQTGRGYVPNLVRTFSHRPEVWHAWRALLAAVKGHMDERRYELITVAAARALGSSYCMLAHGSVLAERIMPADQLAAVVADRSAAGLSAAEVAMMQFADQVARDAGAVTPERVETLRTHGFSDAEIFDIAAVAAARCFFSSLLDALGVQPDAAYESMADPLKRALTVGRPISREPSPPLPAA